MRFAVPVECHTASYVNLGIEGRDAADSQSKMIFHDLGRSVVRNMIRGGVSQPVAMKISGHKTIAIFQRYDITSEEDIRQAVKQTAEHVKAQPALRKVVSIGKK
jgi:hypothetical protein